MKVALCAVREAKNPDQPWAAYEHWFNLMLSHQNELLISNLTFHGLTFCL